MEEDHVMTVTFLIWNPAIRKIVQIPSRTCSKPLYFTYFGFGFDSKNNDYKVLCTKRAGFSDATVCEIYDLSKGVWRGISPVVPFLYVGYCLNLRPECYLNGAVHWTGYRLNRHAMSFDLILLSFNMSDECFQEISMPASASTWNDDYAGLIQTCCITFGGLIHMVVWKLVGLGGVCVVDMSKDCSVWAMKEYGVTESWTKLFNIDLVSALVYPSILPTMFQLWKNGEVLMVHEQEIPEDNYYEGVEFGDRHELLLYNTESRTCELLFSSDKCVSDLCLYEESLVLM